MLSLYEILKASKTGIAPDMWTALAGKNWNGTDTGHEVKELTGIPPLSFRADGTPLIDYIISGNTEQTGTPSPSSVITPSECGDRTKNLLPYLNSTRTRNGITFTHNADGSMTLNGTASAQTLFPVSVDAESATWPPSDDFYTITLEAGTYTLNNNALDPTSAPDRLRLISLEEGVATVYDGTFTITEKRTMYCYLHIHVNRSYDNVTIYPQLEVGSAETSYEPYGQYKFPITSGNTTTPLYLSEPLRKIGEYADEVGKTENLAYAIEQGGITNTGEKTTNNIRVRVKAHVEPNTTYTFVSNALIVIISGFSGETFNNTIASPVPTTQYTFTTGAFDTDIYVTLKNENGTTIRPTDLSDVMLNLGSTAKPYQPYGYAVTRVIKKLVFDGTEIWEVFPVGTGRYFRYMISSTVTAIANIGICSHYKQNNIGSSTINTDVFTINTPSTGGNGVVISPSDVTLDTAADFKSYLAQQYANGTPVTVWYVLATPTSESIEAPTIPTVRGSQTFDVETTLKPSEVYIKYKG